MRTEHGKIDGDILVTEQFTLYGVVTGSIVVQLGGSLQLHGTCTELVIEAGGSAVVYGTVIGNVANKGKIEVHGTIYGNVFSKEGHFQQASNAVIRGAVEA